MGDGLTGPGLDVGQSFEVLAISLGLGGLVGLQRERAESRIAGVRTFPLIAVLGTLSGLVAQFNVAIGACLIVTSMVGVIAASGLGNYIRARPWAPPAPVDINVVPQKEKTGAGTTTEIAMLVVYALGVYVVYGSKLVTIAVAGVVVLLLYAKQLLHRFVDSLGEKDVLGIMQFVLLAFVILPILPDRDLGPYDVLNPRQIWLVVVLVVGMSLVGYIAYKIVGERAGTALSGLLGGVISSTATTASFARRSREGDGALAASAMLAIMLASTVLYARLFVELSAVAPGALRDMALPLGAMSAVSVLSTAALYLVGRPGRGEIPPQENPTNLKAALFFAAIYAAVVLASAAAKEHLGTRGLFFVAGISGLSDMDAITLSSGRAVAEGRLAVDTAWRAIAIALISSMVMKVIICGALGDRRLFIRALVVFSLNIAAGVLMVVLWPHSQQV